MRRNKLIVVVVFSAAVFAACGRSFHSQRSPSHEASFGLQEIEGFWMQPCSEFQVGNTTLWRSSNLVLGEATYRKQVNLWIQSDCHELAFSLQQQGTFALGDSLDRFTRRAEFVATSTKAQAFNKSTSDQLNALEHCGVSSWQLDSVHDVSSGPCGSVSNLGKPANALKNYGDASGAPHLELISASNESAVTHPLDSYTQPSR